MPRKAHPFRRIAILGTGLIGGSFALAVRRAFPATHIAGWDRPDVLRKARKRHAIDAGILDLREAVAGADLVYVALPIGATLSLLPEIARAAAPGALVTDACSTKVTVCRAGAEHFTGTTRFLGGHPMAGNETSGIAAADAELFRGAKYALIGPNNNRDPRVEAFVAVLSRLGATPVWLDAESHDRAAAIVSHLPQLVAIALAGVVRDATNETGLPLTLAGPGLRDSMRLAGSPYAVWRDIALTNSEEIARALDRIAQALEHLRTNLKSRELEDEFSAANELYKILRGLQ